MRRDLLLQVGSPQEWRQWLRENSEEAAEVWLEIRRKRSIRSGVFYEEAVTEALCFGWIDGKMKSVDKDTYILRFSPRRKNSVWSQSNRERADKLIAEGRMQKKGFESIEQARANGKWFSAYSSKEKPTVPADLEQALSRYPRAHHNFLGMANSYQTMYVQWVLEAKKPETRERRIAEIVRRAEQNKRPGE